jgi:hypothetical protein
VKTKNVFLHFGMMKNDEEQCRSLYKNDVVLRRSWKKNYYEERCCSSSRMLFLIFFHPLFLFVYFVESPPRECRNFTKLGEALDLTFFCKKWVVDFFVLFLDLGKIRNQIFPIQNYLIRAKIFPDLKIKQRIYGPLFTEKGQI